MSRRISVSFSRLVLYHGEIGVHRDRRAGFRAVFGFRTLRDVPFHYLANKVRDAYEGKIVPSHEAWPSQRETMRWFIERGRTGIYALDDKIKVRRSPFQSYYILDGHHRALALFILGEREIHASIED